MPDVDSKLRFWHQYFRVAMSSQRDSRELYLEAKAAFAAAELAFSGNPQPGSPEWHLWSELCSQALHAHDAYLQSLRSDAVLFCSEDDSTDDTRISTR